jgi:hypothetical protein
VGSEDEIVKVADGPSHMTVAETDALLYLPSHSRDQLDRVLNIPALSPGWQSSFRAMLEREEQSTHTTGASGLVSEHEPPPAWPGFRTLRVSHINRESSSVLSLVLEPTDGHPLAPALPGQFVVLRLHPNSLTTPAKLFALRPSKSGILPREREARTKRHRQHLSAHTGPAR